MLGVLLEKDISTPEYYPLTVNALVNACNQKTNRDPVVNFDEGTVEAALSLLRHKRLAFELTGGGNRVPKYGHRVPEVMNLGRRELALLCTLLLRGPQTIGELKDRSERLHRFTDLEEVERCLAGLAAREPEPLSVQLPRQPGTKEPRYAQLLTGPVDLTTTAGTAATAPVRGDRISQLEAEVSELREELSRMRQEWDEFRRQFL